MKIFEHYSKINFIDDSNVFVGFDSYQSCCEQFGWSLTHDIPVSLEEGSNDIDPDGYQFDTTFFSDSVPKGCYVEDGGVAVFRLTRGNAAIYLTLWNCHNGYNSHGFEMTLNGETVRSGSL